MPDVFDVSLEAGEPRRQASAHGFGQSVHDGAQAVPVLPGFDPLVILAALKAP